MSINLDLGHLAPVLFLLPTLGTILTSYKMEMLNRDYKYLNVTIMISLLSVFTWLVILYVYFENVDFSMF